MAAAQAQKRKIMTRKNFREKGISDKSSRKLTLDIHSLFLHYSSISLFFQGHSNFTEHFCIPGSFKHLLHKFINAMEKQ